MCTRVKDMRAFALVWLCWFTARKVPQCKARHAMSLAYINFVAFQLQYTLTFLRGANNSVVGDLPL